MENIVMRRQSEVAGGFERKKLPIMRTLARLHGCDAVTLFTSVDASELDISEILAEMVSDEEVRASHRQPGGKGEKEFALTIKGWAEYLKAMGSIYELPE